MRIETSQILHLLSNTELTRDENNQGARMVRYYSNRGVEAIMGEVQKIECSHFCLKEQGHVIKTNFVRSDNFAVFLMLYIAEIFYYFSQIKVLF